MTRLTKTPSGKLTPQQNYLLQRIPRAYELKDAENRVEPAEVKKARKAVEQWEEKENLLKCQAKKRNEALVQKAREAVYFETPEKALAIIRQCEKMLKGCPV